MKPNTFSSLEKAIDILELFNSNQRAYSAIDISKKLGMPISSTYKYIDVLVKRQLLDRDRNTKKIKLGTLLFTLGNLFSNDLDLIEVAMPHIETMVKESNETAMLTIKDSNESICIERLEPNRLIKYSLKPGRRLPLYLGAPSRVLLAHQSQTFIETYLGTEKLVKHTERTITDVEKLKNELEQIKAKGYVLSDSEVDVDAKAISAPIFDRKGKILAGLAIAGPNRRMGKDITPILIQLVKDRAMKISRELGYVDKRTGQSAQ